MKNAVFWYRIARWVHCRNVPVLPRAIDYFVRFVFACWLPHTVRAGKRLVLGYGGLGVVIHGDAELGDNVHIDQGVTIGGNAVEFGAPKIESNVYIGAGAKVLGPIVIGAGSIVGANAVVLESVPARSIVVGVPGRVVKSEIDIASVLFHLREPNYKNNRRT